MNPQEIIKLLAEIEANTKVLDYGKDLKSISVELSHQFENKQRAISKLEIAEEIDQDALETLQNELEAIKELKDKLNVLYSRFKEEKEEVLNAEKQNLNLKNKLLTELNSIVAQEENISAAFKRFNEIREEWKNIGPIPRKNYTEVADKYGKLIEEFFYNINIYKELQEHDLKRNLDLKNDLIKKLEGLDKLENIKALDEQLKLIQKEWDEIGPTFKHEWEGLKEAFWSKLKIQYSRINDYYKNLKEQAVLNEQKKREIISLVGKVLDQLPNDHKDWEEMTALLVKVQDQWKLIGPASKEVNEDLWQEFRSIYDRFFDAKKEFYESLRGVHDQNKELKERLIQKADSLKDSTQWKEASDALIKLQKRWKEIGSAGKRFEQRLWKDFRANCDVFFERKKQFFAQLESEEANNLTAKLEIIKKLEDLKTDGDKDQIIALLKECSANFNAIGNVPRKDKDQVYKNYKTILDAKYAEIGLDPEKLEQIKFNNLLEDLSKSANAKDRLSAEMSNILKQEDKLITEKGQLENNLGFFNTSDPNHPLLKEANAKIKQIENKLKNLLKRKDLLRKAGQEIENQNNAVETSSTSSAEGDEA